MNLSSLGFKLEGVKELEDALDRAEHRFDKAVGIAASKGAAIVQKAAKANIHDVTGELRKHVKRRVWKRKPGFVGIVIGPAFPGATAQQRSYYGAFVEEGHKLEHGTSKVPPHPWLRPASDDNKSRVEAEMAKVFRGAVEGKIEESDAVSALEEILFGE